MKIAFDSSVLLLLVDPDAKAPSVDKETEEEGSARERLKHCLSSLDKEKSTGIVPSPVIAELITNVGASAVTVLEVIETSKSLSIRPFDTMAAVECGLMLGETRKSGKKKGKEWAKVKFDHQIVSIAKIAGAEVIYSDDEDVHKLGSRVGIQVYGVWDLAAPPREAQHSLNFSQSDQTDKGLD